MIPREPILPYWLTYVDIDTTVFVEIMLTSGSKVKPVIVQVTTWLLMTVDVCNEIINHGGWNVAVA